MTTRHRSLARSILWVGLATLVLLAACGPIAPTAGTPPVGSPATPKGPLMAAFDDNLARWQAAGITRYAFTYQPQCFCDTSSRLVVADADGIRIDGVAPGLLPAAPAGVPGLFDLARRAIQGDDAAIAYDPVTGVPTHMVSDPMSQAVDDELTFTVAGWTLDPPDDRAIGAVSLARARWAARQIQDYSMTVRIDRNTYRVTVRDGSPTVMKGGRRLDPSDLVETPADVWSLLQFAADWTRTGRATVTLDDDVGYPTRIVIAPDPASGSVGETVTVADFRILAPRPS